MAMTLNSGFATIYTLAILGLITIGYGSRAGSGVSGELGLWGVAGGSERTRTVDSDTDAVSVVSAAEDDATTSTRS